MKCQNELLTATTKTFSILKNSNFYRAGHLNLDMIPFFPSLRPPIANHIWFEVDTPVNEEAEILQFERDQHNWISSILNAAADINPLGQVVTNPGPETDDEDANDESDDSDSHDDEDDDTNDRVIPGQPERSGLGLYSPGDDVPMNEDGPSIQNI